MCVYIQEIKEHPYDYMYVHSNDFSTLDSTLGTKKFPYNVSVTVGEQYVDESQIADKDRRYIAN